VIAVVPLGIAEVGSDHHHSFIAIAQSVVAEGFNFEVPLDQPYMLLGSSTSSDFYDIAFAGVNAINDGFLLGNNTHGMLEGGVYRFSSPMANPEAVGVFSGTIVVVPEPASLTAMSIATLRFVLFYALNCRKAASTLRMRCPTETRLAFGSRYSY
jgi:hypothetical protein